MTKAVFQIFKSDNIKVSSSFYKKRTKDIINILFELDAIKKSVVFNYDISKVKFSIVFCGNKTIHQINKEYRNKDTHTDVISFAFLDDKNEIIQNSPLPIDLGEIYICYDVAMSNAKKYNNSENRELCFLFVHGLLHLLGYDHMTKEDEVEMFSLQDIILPPGV